MNPSAERRDNGADALRRRARVFRRLRIVVLGLVVGYFFLPYGVRVWIPFWLPFLAALGLEVEFFLGGYLKTRREHPQGSARPDRGPQPHDLAELGGEHWRDALAVDRAGEQHFVPTAGLSDEEIQERLAAYLEDPEAAAEAAAAPRATTPDLGAAPSGFRSQHPYVAHVTEALAALAVVAGILFYAVHPHGWSAVSATNRARSQAVFSREATAIAGHPARVVCDTSGRYVGFVEDADGVAVVGGSRAYLVPGICNTLYQLAFKHRVQSFPQTARAIAVLAHESWHLEGVANEGLTNCYAFQSGVGIGVDLGLSEATARSMMREQLATNASDSAGDTRYLVPPECHNDGADDLHPGSNRFP